MKITHVQSQIVCLPGEEPLAGGPASPKDTKNFVTLRVGTEVIVTYPPERVMTALAPMRDDSPPLQPDRPPEGLTGDKSRPRFKPIMNAGTGI